MERVVERVGGMERLSEANALRQRHRDTEIIINTSYSLVSLHVAAEKQM